MEKNNSVYLVGNSHIDPVWLWRWQDGYAEVRSTFQSVLDRMEEFDDFVFTCACAVYYKWVEDSEPEMFEAIRRRVVEGRWKVVGGMWIQPDCNIPCGESFARHFLYSQRYFAEKFGAAAITGYNVDSFGHTAALPKMLAATGMQNYVMMRPDGKENPDLPGFLFWWEGDDGSRVLTFRILNGYNSDFGPANDSFVSKCDIEKLSDHLSRADAQGLPTMLFYGVGNHGGGPTIKALQAIEKLMENPIFAGRLRLSSPDSYFADTRLKPGIPVWRGELQHHASGCYSACSEIKMNNRRAENHLLSAEKLWVMADALAGMAPPSGSLDKAWQNVLFNQFHDILDGCSIPEAYTDAREAHGEALSAAAWTSNFSAQRVSWAIDTSIGDPPVRSKEKDWALWMDKEFGAPLVVFNPLPWPRNIPVQIPRPIKKVATHDSKPVPVQTVRASRCNGSDKYDGLFMARVPGLGYSVYWIHTSPVEEVPDTDLTAGTNWLENDSLRLEIDLATGAVSTLLHKESGWNAVKEAGTAAIVIDIEHCDTWAHTVFSFRDVVGSFGDASVELLESGPVRAVLRVTSRYGQSFLRQDYTLYAGASQVEVRTRVDWHEHYKMLKLAFSVNVEEGAVCSDIPFGHIRRSANGTEECGQMWMDISGTGQAGPAGLSVLNSGKYAYDAMDSELRLTVVNSAPYADHFAGEHRDNLNDFLDQGVQNFVYALLPHAGGWEDAGVVKAAIALNTEEVQVNETFHKGPLPMEYEGIRVTPDNIVVTALKHAYDGNGVILRLYEAADRDVEATIELPLLNRTLTLKMNKNSIKTLYIPNEPDVSIRECNIFEV